MDSSTNTDRGSGARMIALLKLIGESDGDCALKDLAAGTGMPASSVHRLLQMLIRGGLVERGDGTSYRAGRELFRLSANILSRSHYVAAVRPFLRTLWAGWQETAVFCTYDAPHHRAIVSERILTPHTLRHVLEPYTDLSLTWGSLGRAILAHLEAEDLAAALAQSPVGPLTGAPTPPPEVLVEELAAIRDRGCAIFYSQEADVAGIAAAVFRSGNAVIGSIGLTMPAKRFGTMDRERMASDVMAAARTLSATFGHASAEA
ncbi:MULTISPECIES: IclR family transcriptional regulator [unclassified Sphingobium]|uniref:IclR family transcriptional regulator n=1 Tax=unclassified Sphingobium TaxID=2611147 RepID=UPI00222464F9|nr:MULTISPECIES: IclR family transcriptional regulator [unclassified Sphingobium]MCW2395289.1 DNA-binding IclR family transcriptional regulator [Sphingobium sp. B8D3B]MCW2418803.1 DNA-binding IclR family transcriptional regulator [Sphingobium sp. B8D3C]